MRMKYLLFVVVMLMSFSSIAEESKKFRVFLIQGSQLRANCLAERIFIDSDNINPSGDAIVAIACKSDLTVKKDNISKSLKDIEIKP